MSAAVFSFRSSTPSLSLCHSSFPPSILLHLHIHHKHPAVHHSSVNNHPAIPHGNPQVQDHLAREEAAASAPLFRATCSPLRWNPPLLLHKETLALLQCSIRCCCATALKIPLGQSGGKLKKTGYQQSYSGTENIQYRYVSRESVCREYNVQLVGCC